MGTITKTYSIETDWFNQFHNLCLKKGDKKSVIIQDCIKSYIIDNYEIENKTFVLINDEDKIPVKVIKKENNMFYMSDGNVLTFETFEKIYTDLSVCDVLDVLKSFDDNETSFKKSYLSSLKKKVDDSKDDSKPETKKITLTTEYLEHVFSQRKNLLKTTLEHINNNGISDVTNLFGLIEFQIFVQEYEIILFYNEKSVDFDRYEIIRLVNDVIKNIDKIVNIKFIPHQGEEYNITDEDLLFDGNLTNDFIESFEHYIKRKFGMEGDCLITTLKSMNTGKYKYMINVDDLFLLRNETFLNIVTKYFNDVDYSFDVSRVKSVQNESPNMFTNS